jgi:hypothetical protein
MIGKKMFIRQSRESHDSRSPWSGTLRTLFQALINTCWAEQPTANTRTRGHVLNSKFKNQHITWSFPLSPTTKTKDRCRSWTPFSIKTRILLSTFFKTILNFFSEISSVRLALDCIVYKVTTSCNVNLASLIHNLGTRLPDPLNWSCLEQTRIKAHFHSFHSRKIMYLKNVIAKSWKVWTSNFFPAENLCRPITFYKIFFLRKIFLNGNGPAVL